MARDPAFQYTALLIITLVTLRIGIRVASLTTSTCVDVFVYSVVLTEPQTRTAIRNA